MVTLWEWQRGRLKEAASSLWQAGASKKWWTPAQSLLCLLEVICASAVRVSVWFCLFLTWKCFEFACQQLQRAGLSGPPSMCALMNQEKAIALLNFTALCSAVAAHCLSCQTHKFTVVVHCYLMQQAAAFREKALKTLFTAGGHSRPQAASVVRHRRVRYSPQQCVEAKGRARGNIDSTENDLNQIGNRTWADWAC